LRLIHGDALEVARSLPDNSINLIVTDPPYYRVKGEWWDRQWDTADGFLAWLGEHLAEWQRVLKPNGSLYVFASPRMAARVEVEVGKRFNVLNHIVWAKPESRAQRADKEALRAYFGASERIIFAEHYGADNIAKGEAGYIAKCDELRGFVFEPLRAYLASEWARAGLGSADANIATGSFMANHYLTRSQWALPTRDKYEQLREYANTHNHGGEYLQREYEELRREYEELRRPFTVSADVPYTDVWTFPTVRGYAGKHPCEKPLAMIEHIVKASSRAGDTIFDPFMGSGTSALAAQRLGREFVGCDIEQGWVNAAQARMAQMQMQSALL
jgi:site-specific DNA-methyltransferase (adenine-specific)